MLIEAFCKTGTCERWDINTLAVSLHPECPTCKGHDTFWVTDEVDEPEGGFYGEDEE